MASIWKDVQQRGASMCHEQIQPDKAESPLNVGKLSVSKNRLIPLASTLTVLAAILAGCAAPAGYHHANHNPFSTVLPDHPCRSPYITSKDALDKLNTSRQLLQQVTAIALSPSKENSRGMDFGSNCHVTVTYVDSSTASGVLTFSEDENAAEYGLSKGFTIYWTPDQPNVTTVAEEVPTCVLSEKIAECVRSGRQFPEPSSLALAVSNSGDRTRWMATARGDANVALKLVSLQTCYFTITQRLLDGYGHGSDPDTDQIIVQQAVSKYDYSGVVNGEPLYEHSPLGVFTQSYLYGINPNSLATIVMQVSTDALGNLDKIETGARKHRLVYVSDAMDLVNNCAQQHSIFVTYH
jgi:hypothetical protein